jgi:hypothetical protein
MTARCFLGVTLALVYLPTTGWAGDDKWVEFKSKDGRFCLVMPGKPETHEQGEILVGERVTTHIYQVRTTTEDHLASFCELTPNLKKLDQGDLVDTVCVRMLLGTRGKLLDKKKFTVGEMKHPGREIVVRTPDPNWCLRARALSVGDKLYMLIVAGSEKVITGQKSDEYLDSFKLTD